jgi:cytochrome b involved in lipid metabolism
MKKTLFTLIVILSFAFSAPVFAASTYTSTDVAEHNTTSDCWMSYEEKVYDITEYLNTHNTKFYFIDSWCGTDMTEAYNTKDGQGKEHKSATTTGILPGYYIGDLVAASVTSTPVPTSAPVPTSSMDTVISTPVVTKDSSKVVTTNPYNFWTPFIIVNILLWGNYFFSKTNFWKTKFKPLTYNMIWNTMLIISLIPSSMFGLFMILKYSFPELRNIDFDFVYWHVEGSICFTVIVFAHLILRLKEYFLQVKISFSKPKTVIPEVQ